MKTLKHFLSVLCVIALAAFVSSCGAGKQFLVTSASENLTVLTKITESETSVGLSANGGYGYDGLLLTIKQKGGQEYTNIYKKDNPLSPAMVQITSGNNFNGDPSICVETNRIAYSRATASSSSDICVIAAKNATAMTPITETSNYNEGAPSFSKDGSIIAYHKVPNTLAYTEAEIWIRNLETRENMMLGNGICPMISPDGTKIVYSRYNGPDECHIWIMGIDGNNPQQLTGNKKEFATQACWSQDGRHIVFQCRTEQKKDMDLYVMSADGTDLRQITNNDSYDGNPYWAPDNMIYFSSDRGAVKEALQIWRFNYRP